MTAKYGRGLGTPDSKRKAWKVLSDVMDRCVCRGRLLGQLWGGGQESLFGWEVTWLWSDSVLPQCPVSGTSEKGFLLFELSLFFCKMGS